MLKERHSVRSKSLLRASVLLEKGHVAFDCLVRDISSSGAKLEIDPRFILPQHFELDVPQRSTVFHCDVQWRRGKFVGVRFK